MLVQHRIVLVRSGCMRACPPVDNKNRLTSSLPCIPTHNKLVRAIDATREDSPAAHILPRPSRYACGTQSHWILPSKVTSIASRLAWGSCRCESCANRIFWLQAECRVPSLRYVPAPGKLGARGLFRDRAKSGRNRLEAAKMFQEKGLAAMSRAYGWGDSSRLPRAVPEKASESKKASSERTS